MEYADRGDLTAMINYYKQRKMEFPEEEIWNIVKCVSKGLRDLHNLKIIHRDIKSANLMVNKDKQIKIGDMNVSKLQEIG
jgi:NIMA (never in mitosis gene a)-related kinase